jgi:WD40 repeat protein
MNTQFRINGVITVFLVIIGLTGGVTAASLTQSWQEHPADDASFSDPMISTDGSLVFAGGNQLLVRSWNGDTRWGGLSGNVATMSSDGNYIVSALSDNVRTFNRTGDVIWNRMTGSPFRAVAISGDGSLVIAADDRGYLRSWTTEGVSLGVDNETDQVKRIDISPSQSQVVVSTEDSLKFFSPEMHLIREKKSFGNRDSFLAFSADSATLILAGENQVSSYTARGLVNWEKEITDNFINDMACSGDCSDIVLGSQDGNVWVLNKEGQVQWKYPVGVWVNSVGVSRDGSVIVAGAIDGTVYILDKNGDLLARTKTDSAIQQQSIAINPEGTRIVVISERTMYGYSLDYDPSGIPPVTKTEIPVRTTLTPSKTTTPIPVKTTLPVTVSSPKGTALPETTSTPNSALTPLFAVFALAGLLFEIRRRKN